MIPYGRQDITQDDVDAVVDILTSDFLTQGPAVPAFEEQLCDVTGANYATAVNSATSALHISCLALGVDKGDIVWTVPNTFVASANCALYCGATVDFVDIDLETYNISIAQLNEKLENASRAGNLPKVVIPVHFSGEPCDMQAIKQLSDIYGFKIIEDASHAIGARYRNSMIGSCEYSDITVFSFHPVKIITSGEGGAALTMDAEIDKRLKLLRSHGITRDTNLMRNVKTDPWYYEQLELGYNYRLTDIAAALGLSQLDKIRKFLERRHRIAVRYDEAFSNTDIISPFRSHHSYSSLHLYVIQTHEKKRDFLMRKLRERGILVNLHYLPVHMQPYFQQLGFKQGNFPNAEYFAQCSLSLPIYPKLESSDQDFVIKNILEINS